MLNNDLIIKRLALVKYLYKIGVEQSKQSETAASFSILSLHDSIEMFLKLLAEKKNLKSDKFSFLDYWVNIPELTLKESMRNLNARRVNIKHKGLLPSKSDIEVSRVNTTDFFEQNTLKQFGVEFSQVSLLSLIQYTKVREGLKKAQNALYENRIEDCVENAAIAFDELISSYEDSKSGYYGSSPFSFGENLSFLSSSRTGIGNNSKDQSDQKLAKFVDAVVKSIDEIQIAIKIMSLGIDYKQFTKFKLLTPTISKTMGGTRVAELFGKKRWTTANCQFCIDFVLNSSLKLQDFDFDFNELIDSQHNGIFFTLD